uniref:Putative metalloprotease n=1 Tax=Ixodes ricinus TaxID=34613 RepID=A0A0K8RE34_IXORI
MAIGCINQRFEEIHFKPNETLILASTESEVKLGVKMVLDLHYRPLSRNRAHLTRYLTAFLRAVELRFSDMTDPTIKLILTDIVEMNAIQESKIYYDNYIIRNTIYGVWTRDYLREKENPFKGDTGIILIMTGFNLWRAFPLSGDITNSADPNGACTRNNVALCEDDGLTFSGVGSAAQAVALLLGANFDTNKTPGDCSPYKGYLLSSNTGVSTHYNLSPCGQEQMKKAIKKSEGQRRACLFNQPITKGFVNEVNKSLELPIDFFNNTNPCNLLYGSPSCDKHWKRLGGCKLVCCIKDGSNITVNKHDGTKCNQHKICSNGECIPDPRIPETILKTL